MKDTTCHICQKGFTLLELIVILVMVSILGTVLIQLGGSALTNSGNNIATVGDEADAERVMEQIVADYVEQINTKPDEALTYINTTDYGTNVTKKKIGFDSGGNQTTGGDYLLVSVNSGGHKLTTLFAKTRIASTDEDKETY